MRALIASAQQVSSGSLTTQECIPQPFSKRVSPVAASTEALPKTVRQPACSTSPISACGQPISMSSAGCSAAAESRLMGLWRTPSVLRKLQHAFTITQYRRILAFCSRGSQTASLHQQKSTSCEVLFCWLFRTI